jgi:phosphoribosylformylglycinamidine synthase
LLDGRGGLIGGACNGFQALVKLGLLPYGRITVTKETDPTLTFNKIGRHVSKIVYTRVSSTLSPWFSGSEVGDIHAVPVSHGEGRFIAGREVLEALKQNGQIATQYVDMDGIPRADSDVNPAGSTWAIEGITSPDGRVMGKMGHSERHTDTTYKNVDGNYESGIFENAVRYFN